MEFRGKSCILSPVDWTAYTSPRKDPAGNLASEDVLLETREGDSSAFLLYVDDPCVVIGRNQNPWKEAAPGTGLPVFRRRSGGGAVYHDGGNLNWSFLAPRDAWSVVEALDFVKAAIRGLGLDLSEDPRGALFLDGRKVCGTARRFFRASVLIHGTLLIASDLTALSSALGGLEPAENRAIASVPSPVRNLSSAAPGLTVGDVADALLGELSSRYGTGSARDPAGATDPNILEARTREHLSWDWVYGSTLPFSVSLGSGDPGLRLHVRDGRAACVRAGGRDVDLGPTLEPLLGKPFDPGLWAAVRGLVPGLP